MSNVIPFQPRPVNREHYFGGCPHCGGTDGYFNAGRSHWFVCHEHKTCWCIGSNLFSSWRDETEEEQREKWRRIENYIEVEPLPMQEAGASAPGPRLIKVTKALDLIPADNPARAFLGPFDPEVAS